MADMYPVNGARFYIGDAAMSTQAADFDETDFSAVTWTEVDGYENMGAIGDNAADISSNLINRKRTIHMKGTRDAGQRQDQFNVITGDAGQEALIAAEQTNDNYPFKIEFDDAPATGSAPTPTTKYWIGLVMSTAEQGGGANTARMMQATTQVNSNYVTVAAATGA